MNDHPLSQTSMRRSLARPPAPPASSCPRCCRNGHLAANQRIEGHAERLRTMRFYCDRCNYDWSTDAEEAHLHGRFLQRIDHTHQRGDI